MTALRDLTAQRALEAQYLHAQKMEAVGRLSGAVAHDFNNLLTVIGSYAEILHTDLPELDPRRDDLDQIRKAAGAATSLTKQLLAFSRQQVTRPRVLTLEEVVANTRKMLDRVIGEDIALTAVLAASPLPVMADSGQLEQVIMNLAVNARDAMPAGGKLIFTTLRADVDDAFVRAHPSATLGTFAVLAVTDTGTGMDAATQAKIFEPFFTTKAAGKGTGLGLSTVYGIVQQSGGFILVDSVPDRGTTFKLYFPAASPAG